MPAEPVYITTPESRWEWTGDMNWDDGLTPILNSALWLKNAPVFADVTNRTKVMALGGLGDRSLLEMSFAGIGANNAQAEVAVYLVSGIGGTNGAIAFRSMYALQLRLTLGGTSMSTLPVDVSHQLVDEIIPLIDVSSTPPGLRIMGNVADGWATVAIDRMNATHVILDFNNLVEGNKIGALVRTT